VNPKTVAKWRRRASEDDKRSGPKRPKRALDQVDESIVVALRSYWRISLDDCHEIARRFYPDLTRSSLYRAFRRHGVHILPAVFSTAASRYQRAAFKRPDSYFFHMLRLAQSGRPGAQFLLVVHPLSRLTYATKLVMSDSLSVADAIGEFCSQIPGGVRWLFEASGNFLEFRRVGISPPDSPERRLFDRFGIRVARAPAHFRGAAVAHSHFQDRLRAVLAKTPDFQFEPWLMNEVDKFNLTALGTLGNCSPIERAVASPPAFRDNRSIRA
jgi:hypothetical protein